MSHDHERDTMHCVLKITRLALHAAAVCAAFLTVKEIHRVHKAIEKEKK